MHVADRTDSWRPLGEMLVERGVITTRQLDDALRVQRLSGDPLGAVLVSLDYVAEHTLRNVLLEQCGLDLTRQHGFGSGLLDELERRGVRARARASEDRSVAAAPPEPVAAAAAPVTDTPAMSARSFDALLERFEERSRALADELAAMRRILGELAG